MSTIVTTQEELDAAIESGVERIVIDSPPSVWLEIRGEAHVETWGSSRVVAWDLSHVVARGSSHVVARESSRVVAWEWSTVHAWDYSRVVAWGSSRVVARGSSHVVARESSHVVAWDSSRVVAWDSSRVDAWDSSNVVARGSSHVVARGYSRVEAWGLSRIEAWEWSTVKACEDSRVAARGSARVEARGYSRVDAREWSTVHAWDYSRIDAFPWVAVHRHSVMATVSGGTIIDMTSIDLSDPTMWATYRGIAAKDGAATVYKSVDQELVAGQGHTPTTYAIGSTVEATDWDPTPRCGHGLHFSPTPSQALSYYLGDGEPRLLACEVDVASLVPLDDKCKAPRCRVLHEVDRLGDPIVSALDDEQETTP